jgi:hypothetical protein
MRTSQSYLTSAEVIAISESLSAGKIRRTGTGSMRDVFKFCASESQQNNLKRG